MWVKASADSLFNEKARVMVLKLILFVPYKHVWLVTKSLLLKMPCPLLTFLSPPTGNKDIITAEHMSKMKDQAIVCNIGHFDNEIQVAELEKMPEPPKRFLRKIVCPEACQPFYFCRWSQYLSFSRRSFDQSWMCNWTPKFCDVQQFCKSNHCQLDIRNNPDREIGVTRLSKELDEEVARLHLDKLGAKLTELSTDQADYIGVPVEGPYKPEHYRY